MNDTSVYDRVMDDRATTGGCLCGGVRYRVVGDLRPVWNCYCERCRRITGHFMAATAAPRDAIHVDATETLRWYHPEDDPDVGYAFCSTCGSTLFWRATGPGTDGVWMSIAAGTLDPPTGLRTERALFGAEAADYHELDPTIPTHARDATTPDDHG